MSGNVYECMFILDSNRYAKDPGKVSGQLPQIIEKCGGEVLVTRLWVEQRLCYPIEGHRKGTYWMTYFRIDGEKVPQFTRECQLNENILRHLLLKVDPRLVDTLVAHASGQALPGSEGGDATGGEGEKPASADADKSAEGEPSSEEAKPETADAS